MAGYATMSSDLKHDGTPVAYMLISDTHSKPAGGNILHIIMFDAFINYACG